MSSAVVRACAGNARFLLAIGAALAASCGDNLKPGGEDAAVDANLIALCGNNIVDPNEDCDDGDQMADNVCDATCHFTCGNGVVEDNFGEICDTGIASGTGACPATCDDGMACTSDLLVGSGCQQSCDHADITAPANGDGCCPTGANSTMDDDCDVACNNGILETGETCDTAITTGPGTCPTQASCVDGVACTQDNLLNSNTCLAVCGNPAITTPANGDGCCPPGANSGNDTDCLPGCNNGVVDPGETCDTGIPVGAGSCPTSCADGMVCTRDILNNPGSCTAACTFPPITMPMSADGCCPPGANANNDSDCAPVCGNMVIEINEQCDDGNMNNNDACTNACLNNIPPVAFRMTDLDLRDPHVFVSALGCRDVTDTPFFNFAVNAELQTSIQTDDDNNGLLDLSPTIVFRNFMQTAATQPVEIHFANCTAPIGGTTCAPGPQPAVLATATFMAAGQCLTFLPGTVRPYTPAITSTGGPCFVTSTATVPLNLGGIPITLRDARLAATYVGNPASTLNNGLLMGFISEVDANNTIIPTSFPLVGGQPLSSLLPGGGGNCAGHSDKDTNNGVMGWWFYLNFPAARVPFNG